MPRKFSERDEEQIRTLLLNAGRAQLATRGPRGTSIDDACRAAGIAKGSFYRFYSGKEEWILAVLIGMEDEVHRRLLEESRCRDLTPDSLLRRTLSLIYELAEPGSPYARLMEEEEAAYLFRIFGDASRKILAERDERFVTALLDTWRSHGVEIAMAPDLLAGLTRALVFAAFHRRDLGSDPDGVLRELATAVSSRVLAYRRDGEET